ncbi:MAG: 23S rRNA (adenine(2503)-C(2))-methyltransferase RlmN [Bacilli bacterium]|nr:23S rRNA (adenine(2503)-C(2))-methyltransferase RlmN [Bacilli bacterium]
MDSIYDLDIEKMEEYFLSHNDKKFHADQLFSWLYDKRIESYGEISNIRKETLNIIQKEYSINRLKIEKVERDTDVNKYLFKLQDGEYIEAVLMRHDYGNSICISSQVGCNMGCRFCESGRRKKVRNLNTSEMVLQILQVEQDIKTRISHVVVMGIGEPFDNYFNVMTFIKIINHPKGLQIGSRHITVSTCGILPKIEEFMNFPYQVNLAISLHAPTDQLRTHLMPINKVYPLSDLISVLKKYIEKTNRRITFEYILLDGINDQEFHAKKLSELIKGMNAYVNLIPYNNTGNLGFNRSKTIQIMKFYDILKKNKINVTIRREFGSKISAACGQLRSKEENL